MCDVFGMPRPRKRHVQQEMRYPDKNGQWRGGKRAGAGRPAAKGRRPSERHKRRPVLKAGEAVHVVLRPVREVGNLRRWHAYRALRAALLTTVTHEGFRIVHLSIQRTHIHLIIEATSRLVLARGMQGFQVSAARKLNAAIGAHTGRPRRGTVFADRYHARIIRAPIEARRALAYVLNNWRKHDEHEDQHLRGWSVDLFSSAPSFDGWSDVDRRAIVLPRDYEPLLVSRPTTWLLRDGWRQHGLISSTHVPSETEKPDTHARVLAE